MSRTACCSRRPGTYTRSRLGGPFVFAILLTGAVTPNLVTPTRTEIYLLRVGLVSLDAYGVVVLLGSAPVNRQVVAMLDGKQRPTTETDRVRTLQASWDRFL